MRQSLFLLLGLAAAAVAAYLLLYWRRPPEAERVAAPSKPTVSLEEKQAEAQTILVCTFQASGIVTETESGKLSAEADTKERWSIIFAGLVTNEPVMKGNLGETKLRVLRRTPEGLWLAEEPPDSGLNVFAIFPRSRTAIMSKQYDIGLMLGKVLPFGLISIGKCE